MTAPVSRWVDMNQRHLMAALAIVREALERHVARCDSSAPLTPLPPDEPAGEADMSPALEELAAAFELSPFERHVLVLCAGIDLDASFATLCAAAHGDPRRAYPTFSLALAALPNAHWSALAPDGPLRYWRMIELGSGESLTACPLRIDERVLHHLTGVPHLDDRLEPLMQPVAPPADLPASHATIARRIAALWSRESHAGGHVVMQLCGVDAEGQRAIAAAAGALLGIRVMVLHAADIPTAGSDRDTLRRLWERESVLGGGAIVLDAHDLDTGPARRAVSAFVDRLRTPAIICGRDPLTDLRRHIPRFDVAPPRAVEVEGMWREALGPAADGLNGALAAMAQQFRLSSSAIRLIGAVVLAEERAEPQRLWDACRDQARTHLDDLAQRVTVAATWADLVLPRAQCDVLREIQAHVRERACVYESWGFAKKSARGLGISALFCGASGTGKTMAAEALAHELRLDLYRIDLSQVVSKYIGETEKNLRRVFDAAESGGAVLLFDEADALFGKRSEVKDSHDRYANIEVSYLLQRMEAYRGLAILTTNMKSALDPAFLRRLRFVVEFPFPDAAHRAEIWRRMLPVELPTEGLVVEKLARLAVPGGSIRNIAVHGAFLAADAREPVRMTHLLAAARREYAKLERTLTDAEIGGWT
jgi:hypothetical protein